MINDALTRLSGTNGSVSSGVYTAPAGQAWTNTASTAWYSTNVLDLQAGTSNIGGTIGTQNRDIGEGDDIYVIITIGTAPTSSGSSVLTVDVINSTSASDGSGTITVVGTTSIPVAAATAGAQFAIRVNPQLGSLGSRYLGVRYTNNATAWTGSGTIFADVTIDIAGDSKKFYGVGFKVDT